MFRSKSKTIIHQSLAKNALTGATAKRFFHKNAALHIGGGDNVYHTFKNKAKSFRTATKIDEHYRADHMGTVANKRATILSGGHGLGKLISLNNPRNLNRLDLETTQDLLNKFKQLNFDPNVQIVTFTSKGSYAFSFGWDVHELIAHLKKGDLASATALLREFNKLGYFLATCDKPIATVASGQIVGSGAAIACVSDYVLINPGVSFSSPEVTYGYIPDSGNLYLLAEIERKHPGLGYFMALTGARVEGGDLIHLNLATHFGMPGVEVEILESLKHQSRIGSDVTNRVVLENCEAKSMLGPLSFAKELVLFEKFFAKKASVEEITEALRAENSAWSKGVLEAISVASPTALKVTFAALSEIVNNNLPLDVSYNLAFRAAVHMMSHPDFKEGLRAVFEECDNAPVWSAKTLADVDMKFVQSCITEPLSFDKNQTCDLQFPHELWEEEHIVGQIEKLRKAGKIEIA